jgi:hypothetical protein
VIPYEYVDRRGDRLVTDWPVEAAQWRQLRVLLILLEGTDRDQAVGSVIFKLRLPGIYYAKINGRVALRPRCCVGPHDGERVTFLERVQKSGGVEHPGLRDAKAPERMQEVADNRWRSKRVTFHREPGP